MKNSVRSHLTASVVGGVIVAGGLIAFGMAGRRTTQTLIQEAPVTSERVAGESTALTPHAIYQRESPGVVFVSVHLIDPEPTPFDVLHESQTGTLSGSGFVVDAHGDVLTNYHLIEGASRTSGIAVRFQGGVERSATVVGENPSQDIAVLRVNLAGLAPVAPLPLGSSTSVRIGDPTLAIGDPYGVDRTLTSGIVSSFVHALRGEGGVSVDNVIQTDQPLDAAASGGPLLDAAGRVIGVESQLVNPQGTTAAFATPIDSATPLLRSVQHGSELRMAYLGLTGVAARGTHPAVTVTAVARGGPAAAAGLHRGDAIARLGSDTISSVADMQRMVSTRSPGQRLAIEIRRAGRIRTVDVQLGVQP